MKRNVHSDKFLIKLSVKILWNANEWCHKKGWHWARNGLPVIWCILNLNAIHTIFAW
jgi:hypothetical protein